jgi:HlyD family secretion protein
VTTPQGQKLGEGMLEINMPVPVTGIGGIIDDVYYEEYDSVGSGAKLFHVDGRIPSSDLQLALLNVENTRIDLDIALKKQSKLILRAPIDGVVTAKDAWAGQYLTGGSHAFSLQSNGDFELKADVDELDVANVQEGQNAIVRVDAFPGRTFTGTVSSISSVAKTSGGVATYEVTVSLESSGELRDGMTASMDIVTHEARDILLVPSDAIRTENGQSYVETGDGRKVTVETGISDSDSVEIVSGLEEGDLVRTRERAEAEQNNVPFGSRAANRASGQANMPG